MDIHGLVVKTDSFLPGGDQAAVKGNRFHKDLFAQVMSAKENFNRCNHPPVHLMTQRKRSIDPPPRSQQAGPFFRRGNGTIHGLSLLGMDIQIEVPSIPYRDLSSHASGDSSRVIKQRVERARAIQRERFQKG